MRYWFFLLVIAVGCRNSQDEFSLTIDRVVQLDSIPSASGIAIMGDSVYIVGDDASKIYKLSLTNYGYRKINLLSADTSYYQIPKPVKHDLESAMIAPVDHQENLVAFGSGTLSPYRDSLWIMNLSNETEQMKYSLAPFYKLFIEKAGIQSKDLNMEGAAVAGGRLYLFNRGGNVITTVNWDEFIYYIANPAANKIPVIEIHKIVLPMTGKVQVGFSGACTLDEHTLLFTASAEDTKDWTKDGAIIGSYIGILGLTARGPQLVKAIPLQKDGKGLATKLESIDIISWSNEKIILEAVADNDNGSSAAYRLSLFTRRIGVTGDKN